MILNFSSLLFASLFTGAAGLSYHEAIDAIKTDLKGYETLGGQGLCDRNDCCTISETNSCSLDAFAKDKSMLVLPGGETRCIFSTSTEFAFQVIPGDTDKLLFYFQGGGACWDKVSTVTVPLCTTDASPSGLNGIFDRSNLDNAYRDYTVVQVLYCSGDIHGGNTVRSYDDSNGVPVEQKGIANAQAVLDWVKEQQTIGTLAASLADLVVMGCSAGSIGAQLWSNQIVSTLKWNRAAVVPDSYAGVFPPGTQGPLVYNYGFCTSGFLSEPLYQKCINQELTLQDINMEFIAAIPSVPTTFIQSKTDIVQMSFYVAIGVTTPDSSAAINPEEFYYGVNTIFEEYNKNTNFLTYLVDGDQHCFTPSNVYYTADAMGPKDAGKTNTGPMLFDWTGKYPLSTGEEADTVCEGQMESPTTKRESANNQTYCDSNYVPKAFIENY